jgi:N-acetylmuramoyl-L-alanine amidase
MALPFKDWPTPNQDARPDGAGEIDILVLHYTGMMTAQAALERMRDPAAKVSTHWCIDEDGQIYRLVPETMRAWHAGLSNWRRSRPFRHRAAPEEGPWRIVRLGPPGARGHRRVAAADR